MLTIYCPFTNCNKIVFCLILLVSRVDQVRPIVKIDVDWSPYW